MTLEELNAIVDGVAKPFKEQLSDARQRIAELKEIVTALSLSMPAPVDIQAVAERAAALIPAPKDGVDGRDGESIIGPPGPQGERGERGEAGERGANGSQGPAGESIRGERGERGEKGEPGDRGPVGERGADGLAGKDGKDVQAADVEAVVSRHVDQWALNFERRAQDLFQRAIDNMPKPKDGKDGRDAFDLDDLAIEHDGNGHVTFTYKRGEMEKQFQIRIPRVKYVGVYDDKRSYLEGDNVSAAGSVWFATQDNPPGRPGVGEGWQLAVKRGKDGRDGKAPPEPGPVKL